MRLAPVIEAAHWQDILRWFDCKIANGLLDGRTASFKPPRAQRCESDTYRA
jgi:hypothetical protein